MRVMRWIQGVLVIGLVATAALSSPDRGYADAEKGNAGAGHGEDENYVNIEEAMREYNARYMYFYAEDEGLDYVEDVGRLEYVKWLDCDGKEEGVMVAKPEDGTYKGAMRNKEAAVKIVDQLVTTFYSTDAPGTTSPLYAKFYDIEGETGTSFTKYIEADFPLTWVSPTTTYSGNSNATGVNDENYKDVAGVITGYIKQLKVTDTTGVSVGWTGVGTDNDVVENRLAKPETFLARPTPEEVLETADDKWGTENWSDSSSSAKPQSFFEFWVLYSSGSDEYYSDVGLTLSSNRGRVKLTSTNDSDHIVYMRSSEYVEDISFPGTVSIPPGNPVSTDDKWHEYIVFSGSGPHYSQPIGDHIPDWDEALSALPTEAGFDVYASWGVTGTIAFEMPRFNLSADGGCDSCRSCSGARCAANQKSDYTVGSMRARFGLGMLNDDTKAGFLQIHAQESSAALFTPDMLQVIAADDSSIEVIRETDGTPRQVKTDDLLVDVVVTTANEKYEIRYYHVDASDETIDQLQASKVGGYWVPETGEDPYRTIVVEKPAMTTGDNVRFTEKDETGAVTLVNEFAWDGTTDTWDLYEGLDKTTPALSGAKRRRSKGIDVDGSTRTETMRLKEAGGTVLSETEDVYTQYPFGWVRTSSTLDPGGIELTDTWTYYTTPGEDGYGKVKTYTSQTGYWEHYVYDSDHILSKTIRQLSVNAYDGSDIATLESDNVVEEIAEVSGSKTIDGSAEDLLVVKVTTKRDQGTVEQVRYTIYRGTSDVDAADLDEVWTLRSADADPQGADDILTFIAAYMNDFLDDGVFDDGSVEENAAASKHILARTWTHKSGEDDEFDVACMISPDGQYTIYDYSTANTTVVKRGYSDSSLSDVWDDTFGGTGGTDIEYGTRSTTVTDAQGNLVSTKSEKKTEDVTSGWFITSFTKTADTDAFGRPTETAYYFGEAAADEAASSGGGTAAYSTSVDYGTSCCGGGGEVITRTGRDGVAHKSYPDDLGRTTKSVRAAATSGEITSLMVYDAAGRVTERGIDENEDGDLDDANDLKTVTTYDDAGRVDSVTDPEGRKSYMTYRRVTTNGGTYTGTGVFYWETRSYGHDDDAPVSVTWRNSQGNTVLSYTGSGTWTGAPSGGEALTEHTRSTSVYDWANRMTEGRAYFDIASLAKDAPGIAGTTSGGNYLVTGTTEYDALGRGFLSIDVAGNATKTEYEAGTGRAIKTLIGVDGADANTTVDDNELHTVSRVYYNKFESGDDADDPTGDDRPWPTRAYSVRPGLTSAPVENTDMDDYVYTETVEEHTVDGTKDYMTARKMWSRPEHGPWSYGESDEQGRPVGSYTTRNGNATYLLTKSATSYYPDIAPPDGDDGKPQYADQFTVTSGSAGTNKLRSTYTYDDAGRQVKTEAAGRGYSKTEFDAYGRTKRTVFASSEGTNTDADAFTDDIILSESVPTYDKSGRVTGTVTYERAHDATATGLLSAAAADQSRATYGYTWYDDNGRATHRANVGTDSSYTYVAGTPPTPNTSDDVLVSKTEYDAPGRPYLTTDNLGRKSRAFFDDLGRVTHSVENWDGVLTTPDSPGSRDADVNRITKSIYDNSATGGGARIELVAIDPDADGTTTDNQSTLYIHSGEVDADERGPIPVNGRPIAILMPDAIEDGTTRANVITEIDAGGEVFGDFAFTEYYANGQVERTTDPRGVQITATYEDESDPEYADDTGRLLYTEVSLATGATWTSTGDLRTAYTYGDAGERLTATTFDVATGGSSNETSKLTYIYDGFYNITEEKQDHDPTSGGGAGDPKSVFWAYDTTVSSSSTYSKAYRLDKITYPNGRVIQLNYDGHSGIDDAIGRANAIEEDSSGDDIVSYTYLGSGRMARKDYAAPDVRLDFIDESGEGSDANDDYEVSLDAFGRPLRHQWETYDGSGDAEDDLIHLAHAYDRNSNRLYDHRKGPGNNAWSKAYTQDELDRITAHDTGLLDTDASGDLVLTSGKPTVTWRTDKRVFDYDQLGNPTAVDTGFDSDDRYGVETNEANEITTLRNDVGESVSYIRYNFNSSSELDRFTKQTNASTGSDLPSGTTSINTMSGTLVINHSSVDAQNPALLMMDTELGALPSKVEFQVASLPDGVTAGEERGLVGYVFGYKGPTDFWVYGRNMVTGTIELYHMCDANGNADGDLDFDNTSERQLIGSGSTATVTAGVDTSVTSTPASNSADNDTAGASLLSEGGFPPGRVGLYAEVDDTSFDYFLFNRLTPAYALGANWQNSGPAIVTDSASGGDGRLVVSGGVSGNILPALVSNLNTARFEITFQMTRGGSDPKAHAELVFGYDGCDNHERIQFQHSASPNTVGRIYEDGDTRSAATYTLRDNSKIHTPTAADDPVWFRITSDGTTLTVYSADSEANLASASACYASTDFALNPGRIGFVANNYTAILDDITLKTDTDANGSYETTDLVETFPLSSNDDAEDALEYDAAGNLTFDGALKYTFDAYNRVSKIEQAFKDPGHTPAGGSAGDLAVGSTIGEYQYDALGRRIKKDAYATGQLANVEHFYYTGHSNIETRNGSDQVTQQHVWDNLAGHYIDSLAQVANNANPGVDDDGVTSGVQDLCEDDYYALQDQQFNVLAITDDTGSIVERYEYTLYGERTVMTPSYVVIGKSAYGVQMGFQGLYHDDESGLIYNRARMLDPGTGRFIQRDPLGYPDGMNTYAAYHVMSGKLDLVGLSFPRCTSLLPTPPWW